MTVGSSAVQNYLTFSNALLWWYAGSALVLLARYLWRKIRENGGWCYIWSYIRDRWLRVRGDDGGEFAIALTTIILGLFIRCGAILWWRNNGAEWSAFPFPVVNAGDLLMVFGLLCFDRCIIDERTTKSPWNATVAIALSGVLFALIITAT